MVAAKCGGDGSMVKFSEMTNGAVSGVGTHLLWPRHLFNHTDMSRFFTGGSTTAAISAMAAGSPFKIFVIKSVVKIVQVFWYTKTLTLRG